MGRFLDIVVSDEPWHAPGEFWLSDPDGGEGLSYSFVDEPNVGDVALAMVKSTVELRFTPIDHNSDYEAIVQNRNDRCDGFLRSADETKLIFVELKNRDVDNKTSLKSWLSHAVDQLRQTIVSFRREEIEKRDLAAGGLHWAFVCNPKGPYEVPVSIASKKAVFVHATRNFQLFCSNEIVIGAEPATNEAGVIDHA